MEIFFVILNIPRINVFEPTRDKDVREYQKVDTLNRLDQFTSGGLI